MLGGAAMTMILFVDDEPGKVKSHMEALHFSGYEVKCVRDVDAALQALSLERIDLVVLDIMMPYGAAFSGEATTMGTRTGVLLYEHIRQRAPNLPIIVYTNVTDSQVADRFGHESRCWFRRKDHCLARDLTKLVTEIMSSWSWN
jgi:CheY-like chemotaxis protein